MSRKSKGINAERELVHAFWKAGWAAIRIAGSGSMRYPSPDVLAGKGERRLAIECKASAETKKYLTKKEVEELEAFARIFIAEPWIGVRFDKTKWFFITTSDLENTEGAHYVSVETAQRKGMLFEELIEA